MHVDISGRTETPTGVQLVEDFVCPALAPAFCNPPVPAERTLGAELETKILDYFKTEPHKEIREIIALYRNAIRTHTHIYIHNKQKFVFGRGH